MQVYSSVDEFLGVTAWHVLTCKTDVNIIRLVNSFIIVVFSITIRALLQARILITLGCL